VLVLFSKKYCLNVLLFSQRGRHNHPRAPSPHGPPPHGPHFGPFGFGIGPNGPFVPGQNGPFGPGPNGPFGQGANGPFGPGPNGPFGPGPNGGCGPRKWGMTYFFYILNLSSTCTSV
jgi:hypothetical protein